MHGSGRGHHFIGVVTTSHTRFPKQELDGNMKDTRDGRRLVLTTKVEGVDLFVMGYKYNKRKGIHFIATVGAMKWGRHLHTATAREYMRASRPTTSPCFRLFFLKAPVLIPATTRAITTSRWMSYVIRIAVGSVCGQLYGHSSCRLLEALPLPSPVYPPPRQRHYRQFLRGVDLPFVDEPASSRHLRHMDCDTSSSCTCEARASRHRKHKIPTTSPPRTVLSRAHWQPNGNEAKTLKGLSRKIGRTTSHYLATTVGSRLVWNTTITPNFAYQRAAPTRELLDYRIPQHVNKIFILRTRSFKEH
jgi:hypothetical protein